MIGLRGHDMISEKLYLYFYMLNCSSFKYFCSTNIDKNVAPINILYRSIQPISQRPCSARPALKGSIRYFPKGTFLSCLDGRVVRAMAAHC